MIVVAIMSVIPIDNERENLFDSRYEAKGNSKTERSTAKEKGINIPRAS